VAPKGDGAPRLIRTFSLYSSHFWGHHKGRRTGTVRPSDGALRRRRLARSASLAPGSGSMVLARAGGCRGVAPTVGPVGLAPGSASGGLEHGQRRRCPQGRRALVRRPAVPVAGVLGGNRQRADRQQAFAWCPI
jgi:hypothetical protein